MEARRSQVLLEVAELGDFRRSSVHAFVRRCDKSNRACASGEPRPGGLGSGLGLVICKGLVEAHRGRIWVESDGAGRVLTYDSLLRQAWRGLNEEQSDPKLVHAVVKRLRRKVATTPPGRRTSSTSAGSATGCLDRAIRKLSLPLDRELVGPLARARRPKPRTGWGDRHGHRARPRPRPGPLSVNAPFVMDR